MTREEAIRILKNFSLCGVYHQLIHMNDTDSEAISMAIEALEKQVPIQVGYKQKQYGEYLYCPECRHTVKWIRGYEYCAYCGKAIEFPDFVSKDAGDLWLTEETLEGETWKPSN